MNYVYINQHDPINGSLSKTLKLSLLPNCHWIKVLLNDKSAEVCKWMSILDTTAQASGCQLSNGSLFHWKWPARVRLWHVVFCWTCVHYGKRPSCLCQRNIFLPTWSDVALHSIQIWRPWLIPEYMSGTRRCFQCQVIVRCSRFCCAEILGETTQFGLSLAMSFWIK